MNNYFGCNFKQLINSYRVKYAKSLLDGDRCLVKDLFKESGFVSKSAFYTAFHKRMGITPLKYLATKSDGGMNL
ncbi:AraC family transcriptional regulator [uncultured Phocaeicola sp.]|uniref:helix-turn-helix domain-containing protein n=1 Tax=uncultured Phocaeicola sp. TaxID=990718 RepID=UPI0026297FF3|nr:helix-turn-helix domain-containing protein [uncultured Phocaeicola sp.]